MRGIPIVLLAFALTVLLLSPATAQLAKEDFNGVAGDTLNTHGFSIVGSGSVYLNPITVVSPGLTYGTYAGSGIGNAVVLKNAGQDLGSLFYPDSIKTGPVYAAFLVNISAVSTGDYFFCFLPALPTASYPCRIYAKTDSAGGYYLGVSKTSEAPVYGTTHYSLNTTYLLVTKFTLVPGSNNDLISLYAFSGGDVAATEPATAEVKDYNGSSKGDLPAVSVWVMRQGGGGAPTLTFDGLRIDTTWAGAIGVGASIRVSPKALSFGKIMPGMQKNDSVLVRNAGTLPLEISGVSSTEPAFDVTPQTGSVAAGDSLWFRVAFAPTAGGPYSGTITFHNNGAFTSDSVVAVSGSGVQFLVTPSSLAFGKVWTDEPKADTLTVTNSNHANVLTIDSVKSMNANFSVTPTDATVDTMQAAKFVVTYHPATAGADTGLVIFYHSAESHQDTVLMTGTGAVKTAALVLEKKVASFGRVLVNGSRTDSVKIKNTGELALVIAGVSSKDTSLFGVTLGSTSVLAGDSTYVRVTFHPQTVGEKADTIVFSSNTPGGVDTLFVNGTSDVPVAMFSLSTKSASFGSVRLGQQKSDTLLIKNAGELTLKVSGFAQRDTSFHLTMESDSTKAGDSTRVFVRFAPTAAGMHRDTVVFTSNAAEVTDTLTLSGTASDVISMAAARALPNGTEVIVRGIVTRVKGAYTFLQDSTGGMIMYSSVAGAPAFDSVASKYIIKGDLLEIDGKTSEYNSLKEIASADIISFRRISRGSPLPEAQVVTLAEIASHGEQYEAELITIKKAWFPGASGSFANSTTYSPADSSDGSGAVAFRVQSARDCWLGGLTVPTGPFTYTGVLGQFSSSNPGSGYQLLPVDTLDVVADPLQGISTMPAGVPTVFELGQNFPNPFNPTTTIQYALPVESRVTVTIYSVLGQAIRTLVSETQKASYYRVVWDGLNEAKAPVATGIYFYRVSAEPAAKGGTPFVQVKKMLMLK